MARALLFSRRSISTSIELEVDDLIRVSYSKTEIVSSVDEREHNIICEALKMAGLTRCIEVVYED